jgi:type III pantothenate kinase
MILAVDAGNSRTKWGLFDAEGALLAQGVVDNTAIAQLAGAWQGIRGCRQAVLSCVAGEAQAAELVALLDALNMPVHRLRASQAACGVRNGYASPAQLGTDRWAALIAAWNRHRGACVVATAGTALTVDALSGEGDFLGGLIVPGVRLMREVLATSTAGVAPAPGQWQDFPASTADAVYSGALAAMAGAVRRMGALLEAREGHAPLCLLSGGDAGVLADVLDSPAVIEQNLVLQGLYWIGKTLR